MRKGELFSEQNTLNDSIFKKPSAYHTLTGRKVYAGGGIMPDIFVPADTAGNTTLVQELGEQQLFNAYTIDQFGPILNKFNSADAFINEYNISDDEFDRFILYASKTIKEMDPREIKASRETIKTLLKATAARFKWGDNAYFEVMNSDDVTLKKAVEAVN
jgi:carboxyl-terminal processing protease